MSTNRCYHFSASRTCMQCVVHVVIKRRGSVISFNTFTAVVQSRGKERWSHSVHMPESDHLPSSWGFSTSYSGRTWSHFTSFIHNFAIMWSAFCYPMRLWSDLLWLRVTMASFWQSDSNQWMIEASVSQYLLVHPCVIHCSRKLFYVLFWNPHKFWGFFFFLIFSLY